MHSQRMKTKNLRLGTRLGALTVVMFLFGYALVPLYDVFCDITGLNGKTGRISSEVVDNITIDESRLVTVEFVTNVNVALPWDFKPPVSSIRVHPGVETTVEFEAVNRESYEVVGSAVPSVAPNTAARYFSKTECFCFTQQTLAAGESRKMPVRFVVDPKLPMHVTTLTLAYTFFESPELGEIGAIGN